MTAPVHRSLGALLVIASATLACAGRLEDVVRAQAAGDLGCPESQVTVRGGSAGRDGGSYAVTACGRERGYQTACNSLGTCVAYAVGGPGPAAVSEDLWADRKPAAAAEVAPVAAAAEDPAAGVSVDALAGVSADVLAGVSAASPGVPAEAAAGVPAEVAGEVPGEVAARLRRRSRSRLRPRRRLRWLGGRRARRGRSRCATTVSGRCGCSSARIRWWGPGDIRAWGR